MNIFEMFPVTPGPDNGTQNVINFIILIAIFIGALSITTYATSKLFFGLRWLKHKASPKTIVGHTINFIRIIIALPFVIIGGIFSGFSRTRNIDRNQQNGADIRALCTELGVPTDSYNHIVINHMDKAKDLALKIGRPGELHHASPWNTRLALAISAIDGEQKEKTARIDDLVHALKNYIGDYEKQNGSSPKGIMLDHHVHSMFAEAGVYKNKKSILGDIDIIPVANIAGGLTWKAIGPIADDDAFL